MRFWLLLLVGCNSGGLDAAPPSAPEICRQVCQRLTSCQGDPLDSCLNGFHCAEQTAGPTADCEQGCLSIPGCGNDYLECRETCLHPGCTFTCPACASGETCLVGGVFFASCLRLCATSDDCAPGFHCVALLADAGGMQDPICVSDTAPSRCPGSQTLTCSVPTTCLDSRTLQQQFFSPGNGICGGERVACANGCNGDHCQ